MKKKLAPITALLFLVCLSASAQMKTITGRIVSEDLEVLDNATIRTKDSKYTTVADEHGNYSIKVPDATKELVALYIAMETDTIPIIGKCQVNIILLNHMIIEYETVEQAKKHYKRRKKDLKPIYKKAYEEGVFKRENPCS